MKKLITLLVLAVVCSTAYSQNDRRCGDLSGASSPAWFGENFTDTILPHTQKTLLCGFDTMYFKSPIYRSVSLTAFKKANGNIISEFILTEEDDIVYDDCTKYRHITLSDTIKVNDIACYGDTLYFCGYTLTMLNHKGFIASVALDDLFDMGVDSVNYFHIGYEVKKLVVFPDNNNNQETTIFAMGTTKTEYEPYPLPSPFPNSNPIWFYPAPKYFDFVLLHCPKQYYSRYFECSNDIKIEKFQNITVSLGCAELVSLRYPRTTTEYYYTTDSILTSKELVYRKFRTPDLYVKTNFMDIRFFDNETNDYFDDDNLKGIYDVKISLLNVDNFLLTFSYFSNNTYSAFANRVVFNMGIDNARFRNLSTSRIYTGRSSKDIIDFQYLRHSERLLVLMRDAYDDGSVTDVDISAVSNSYFLRSTPTITYNTTEIIPKDIFLTFNGYHWSTIGSFNGIIKLNDDCFRLVGEYGNDYMTAFATFQFVRSTTSDCHFNYIRAVNKEPFPININRIQTDISNSAQIIYPEYIKMPLPTYTIRNVGVGNCTNENIENIH